jgi:hypothetical protein
VSLARLALGAWLAFIVTIVITAWLSLTGVLHPSCLPMLIPMGVMLVCSVALLLGGVWRVIRGPGRHRALVWVLVGTMPFLAIAAGFEHMILSATGRAYRPTLLTRFGTAFSSVLVEPYVRVRYTYRHEGRRCVLWSARPNADEAVLATMDAHIERMEQLFGEESDERVYWVRGPVWGIDGRYALGWSVGCEDVESQLTYPDRHEAAHFVLHSLLPPDEEVPRLLDEGWAEVYSGEDALARQHDCLRAQLILGRRGLRELVDRDSYYHSDGPMYYQGCLLVDYLLRRFGHPKFLEFCRTCREATFDEDLRRVFGIGLDELEDSYQADLPQYDSLNEFVLTTAGLEDGVDYKRWLKFAKAYSAGAKRLRTAFRQSSVETLRVVEETVPDKERRTIRETRRYHCDGSYYVSMCGQQPPGSQNVNIRTPDLRLRLSKSNQSDAWTVVDCDEAGYDFDRRLAVNSLRLDYLGLALLPLDPVYCSVVVESIGESPRDARLVRVCCSIIDLYDRPTGWWDFDPEHDYAIVASEVRDRDGCCVHTTLDYQTIDGHTAPKTVRLKCVLPDGAITRSWTEEVTSCRFGPPEPEVFELSSYGGLHGEELVEKAHSEAKRAARKVGAVCWTAGGWSIAALLFAMPLLIRPGVLTQRRKDDKAQGR